MKEPLVLWNLYNHAMDHQEYEAAEMYAKELDSILDNQYYTNEIKRAKETPKSKQMIKRV